MPYFHRNFSSKNFSYITCIRKLFYLFHNKFVHYFRRQSIILILFHQRNTVEFSRWHDTLCNWYNFRYSRVFYRQIQEEKAMNTRCVLIDSFVLFNRIIYNKFLRLNKANKFIIKYRYSICFIALF